jgi:hypothetical protein
VIPCGSGMQAGGSADVRWLVQNTCGPAVTQADNPNGRAHIGSAAGWPAPAADVRSAAAMGRWVRPWLAGPLFSWVCASSFLASLELRLSLSSAPAPAAAAAAALDAARLRAWLLLVLENGLGCKVLASTALLHWADTSSSAAEMDWEQQLVPRSCCSAAGIGS